MQKSIFAILLYYFCFYTDFEDWAHFGDWGYFGHLSIKEWIWWLGYFVIGVILVVRVILAIGMILGDFRDWGDFSDWGGAFS